MGNKDRDPNKNSQGVGLIFYRSRCATCGKQSLGKCLIRMDGSFACNIKNHMMRDFPNIKEKGKQVNKSPQGCLDSNAPKKNHP